MPSISLTATKPTRTMRSPVVRPPIRLARAGSCFATPTAGALPGEVYQITLKVIDAGIPGSHLGIHTHDDTGNAVANSLAAINAGARQVQGTLNGLGERCGNANLTTLIPTFLLKEPYKSTLDTGVTEDALKSLVKTSRMLDDILNRVPLRSAPYVGASAFAHKAGLHASAILKDPTTYEHIPPETVGNARIVPMSNQAGQSNLRSRLADMGLEVSEKADLGRILDRIKQRESEGYSYDTAQASFELEARRELGLMPAFFEVERYRATVERRRDAKGREVHPLRGHGGGQHRRRAALVGVRRHHGRRQRRWPGQRAFESAGERSRALFRDDHRHGTR